MLCRIGFYFLFSIFLFGSRLLGHRFRVLGTRVSLSLPRSKSVLGKVKGSLIYTFPYIYSSLYIYFPFIYTFPLYLLSLFKYSSLYIYFPFLIYIKNFFLYIYIYIYIYIYNFFLYIYIYIIFFYIYIRKGKRKPHLATFRYI